MGQRVTDEALFERFLDRFVDRLAAELADRVEQRLDRLQSARQSGAGLDSKQAAARLGVSERTLRELVVSGQVPSVKVGRRRVFSAAAIERLMTNGTVDPAANWQPIVPPNGAARRRRG
jgi:excisionase family DNA binding protein